MHARCVLLWSALVAGLLHTIGAAPIGPEAIRDGGNISPSLPNMVVPHNDKDLPRGHEKRFLNDAKKALKGTAKVVKKVVVGKGKGKEEEKKEKPKSAISMSGKKISMGEVAHYTTLVLPDAGDDRRSLKAFERNVIDGKEDQKEFEDKP